MHSRSRTPVIPLLLAVTAALVVGLMLILPRRPAIVLIPPPPVSPPKAPVLPSRIAVSRQRLAQDRLALANALFRSHSSAYSLVVDKSAYRVLAYHRGELVAAYPVELGPNPIDPKERVDDGCTPEGVYRVTARKERGQTDFHRALLIDYPNALDRRMRRTGGAIEIHGCGTGCSPEDGGSNWTAGCVALSNGHMDSLFSLEDGCGRIDVGTPVTIVYAGTLNDSCYAVTE